MMLIFLILSSSYIILVSLVNCFFFFQVLLSIVICLLFGANVNELVLSRPQVLFFLSAIVETGS